MPTIELTEKQYRRLEDLTAEIEAAQAGAYATVQTSDAVEYLLDLADAADDPDRTATPADAVFPAAAVRAELESRHRKSDDEEPMDLYTIAAELGISGRSSMTKAELVDAIVDQASSRYENPFTGVDVPFPPDRQPDAGGGSEDDEQPAPEESSAGGSPQLDAMLNLMETHSDKWTKADGDARYEVTLPDGATETARTQDDVRALLFKHY